MESALTNLSKVAEVNTIIGKPIVTMDGTTILPISQITFAFMAGGGEYGNKANPKRFVNDGVSANFAGGFGGGGSRYAEGFFGVEKKRGRGCCTQKQKTGE